MLKRIEDWWMRVSKPKVKVPVEELRELVNASHLLAGHMGSNEYRKMPVSDIAMKWNFFFIELDRIKNNGN